MEITRTFKELTKSDIGIAGGKGASLGEMTQAGIPVPSGFVVLSNVFEYFIAFNNLGANLGAILQSVNYEKIDAVENASKQIRALILNALIPKNIADKILCDFDGLDSVSVAVRSSATAEDSSTASWAGMLESYLNVTKIGLLENVKKCWASFFLPKAMFYRFDKNLHKDPISIAVVVQRMVQCQRAGVSFSVHPITQDKNQILIEAGTGLGTAVVSGQITPDRHSIEKTNLRIIENSISDQTKSLTQSSAGETDWKRIQSDKPKLDHAKIIELAKITIKIEDHFGFPVDVEWGLENDNFLIVQSRPITTLRRGHNKRPGRAVYKKRFNRHLPIWAAEYYYLGKHGAFRMTGGCADFSPLYVNSPGKGCSLYFAEERYNQSLKMTLAYLKRNPEKMRRMCEDYKRICLANRDFVNNTQTKDLRGLFDLSANHISPYMMIALIIGGAEGDDKETREVIEVAKIIRYWDDKFLYQTGLKIYSLITDKFSWSHQSENAFYVTIDEALSNNPPAQKEIKKRQESWLLLDGNKLYVGKNIDKFLERNNIILQREESIRNPGIIREFMGVIAQKGKAMGVVKTLFIYEDIFKVDKGDILVSPMTSPEFIPAIRKSAAIITDEGGITCHAAIIARELKIPCIIGTKTATKVLKEGDMVEVDADHGIVRILK